MNDMPNDACCSAPPPSATATTGKNEMPHSPVFKYVGTSAVLIAVWWLIYSQLKPFADFILCIPANQKHFDLLEHLRKR